MRTKALVLTAAIGAIGLASATAEVYSVNVVGFVNHNLTNGWNLVANPLKATNDTVAAILPVIPDGTSLTQWDPNNQMFKDPLNYDSGIFGGWSTPETILAAGEAFFINCPQNTTVTFVGEVRQGSLTTALAGNYSFVGSQVPQSGGITTTLGYAANDGDSLTTWNPTLQMYNDPANYDMGIFGGWSTEPVIGIAEGFILNRGGVAGSWARTFQVQ